MVLKWLAGLVGRVVICAAALVSLAPHAAAAQTPGPVEPSLESAVSSGRKVRVDLRDGRTQTGTVFTVWPTLLELVVDGQTKTMSARDISRISVQYRDPVVDGVTHGVFRGALIGGVLGAVLAASECGNDTFLNFCSPEGFLVIGGLLAGTGAGVGALGGFIGDVTRHSYRAVWPVPTSGSKIDLQSLVSPGHLGARVVIDW